MRESLNLVGLLFFSAAVCFRNNTTSSILYKLGSNGCESAQKWLEMRAVKISERQLYN